MSILGYSSAYFLSQYEADTPLYGEKLIPLLDYVLSTDYSNTEMLATAFYAIQDKYKNTADLPIKEIDAVIDECGYGYIRNLLGEDEDSLKLFVYLLVMVHQLKGSKKGIETVLGLLKTTGDELELSIIGEPEISPTREVTGFTPSDFVMYSNFNIGSDVFEINFLIKTGANFDTEQCIASVSDYGFYLGIDTNGKLVLKLGRQLTGGRAWQEFDGSTRVASQKTLLKNTTYYISFMYSGYDYSIRVSMDGEKYSYYLLLSSSTPLNIYGGNIYLGIDRTTEEFKYPFGGTISLAPFTVSSKNVIVKQWFEEFPVEEEDTFTVDAEVDIGLISSDFFVNFAKFAERYVYPTLKSFRAKLALKSKVTFLPYVRQNVTYVASNVKFPLVQYYLASDPEVSGNYVPYLTKIEETESTGYETDYENFAVQFPKDN